MQAAIFEGAGQIIVKEVPNPEPSEGEVLVRVHYCGICGSDLEAFQSGFYEHGMIIGHEFAGEIIALGEAVHGWNVGDKVTAEDSLPCGHCWFCKQGRQVLCRNLSITGVTHNGGMAEYVSLPVENLHRLPENVTTRQAALAEPLAVCLHGIRRSSLKVGDIALVLGGGTMGLLMLQCAVLAGARSVFVSEVNPVRASLTKELGAKAVFNPLEHNLVVEINALTDGLGPDVVYVCTSAPSAYQDALNLVRAGGQVFVLGLCVEPVPTDFLSLVMGEIDIQGGYIEHGEIPAALDYIAQKQVRVEPLISREIRLDEVVMYGFKELLKPDTEAIKILVSFEGGTP